MAPDRDDSDFRTYEVDFDNGVVLSAVRVYHLLPASPSTPPPVPAQRAAGWNLTASGDEFIDLEQQVLQTIIGRGIISHDDLARMITDPVVGGSALRDIIERGQQSGITVEQMADKYLVLLEGVDAEASHTPSL